MFLVVVLVSLGISCVGSRISLLKIVAGSGFWAKIFWSILVLIPSMKYSMSVLLSVSLACPARIKVHRLCSFCPCKLLSMLLLFLRSCMRVRRGSSSCWSWRSWRWDQGMHCRTGWTCWGRFCLHWTSWGCWFRFLWELWLPCHHCHHFHILMFLLVMLSLQTLFLVWL